MLIGISEGGGTAVNLASNIRLAPPTLLAARPAEQELAGRPQTRHGFDVVVGEGSTDR